MNKIFTVPVYITLKAENSVDAKRKINCILRSEVIEYLQWTIGNIRLGHWNPSDEIAYNYIKRGLE